MMFVFLVLNEPSHQLHRRVFFRSAMLTFIHELLDFEEHAFVLSMQASVVR